MSAAASRSEAAARIADLPTPVGPVIRRTGTARTSEAERVGRPRARVDDHALRLQVQLERVDTELAPESGLLVAAERNPREGRIGHVDPYGARLDLPRQPVAARGIAGPDRGHEPIGHVVGDPD